MSQIIKTTPFDFEELYSSIKQKFDDAGYDVAEGSNTSMLVTAQAYLASNINANAALNVNESLLPFARKRENILNDARALGYEVRHISSYIYNVTIAVPIKTERVCIPKYTLFTDGEHQYYYFGSDIVLTPDPSYNGEEEIRTVDLNIKEGLLYRYNDEESLNVSITNTQGLSNYYVDIPYTDIENDGIECYVTYYDEYGVFHDHELFYKSDKTMLEKDETLIRKYIRIDDIDYGTPRLYFRYAGSGEELQGGSELSINILESSGSKGAISGDLKTEIDCEIKSVTLVQAGQDEESSLSIKNNAPRVYNCAGRLVTSNDYEAACNRDTRVSLTSVWGGEKEFPIAPGHIWFSFLIPMERDFANDDVLWTRNNFENFWQYTDDNSRDKALAYYQKNYLMNDSIRSSTVTADGTLLNPGVWDKLDEMHIPTLVYHNRNPIFLTFDYDITILKYLISDEKAQAHKEIFDIIDKAFTGDDNVHYESFNTEYFNASMIKRIDERVTDISGFELELKNSLVLNSKTVSVENSNSNIRDIYIPLSIPYEKYFDDNGCLIIDYLPKIDTKDFIQYMGEVGNDLYVDWSAIRKDIEMGIPQKTHKLIIAPIKCHLESRETFDTVEAQNRTVVLRHEVYPKNFGKENITESKLNSLIQENLNDGMLPVDFTLPEVPEFDCTVTLIRRRENDFSENIINHSPDKIDGWYLNDRTEICFTPNIDIETGDEVVIEQDTICGFYYIFNSLKREILVHLFVDGSVSGFEQYLKGNMMAIGNEHYLYSTDDFYFYTNTEEYLYCEAEYDPDQKYAEVKDTTPKSYLFSVDNRYLYTPDSYYLTTEGYAVQDPNEVNSYTGSVVREVNENMYRNSPLKADLFFRNRYLNLDYNTKNFQTLKNVIPMLRKVEFHNIIS